MPGAQLPQRAGQGRDVERAQQPQRDGAVVLGPARLELVQEPQPLLRERQRQRAGAVRPRDGGGGGPTGEPAPQLLTQLRRQARDPALSR